MLLWERAFLLLTLVFLFSSLTFGRQVQDLQDLVANSCSFASLRNAPLCIDQQRCSSNFCRWISEPEWSFRFLFLREWEHFGLKTCPGIWSTVKASPYSWAAAALRDAQGFSKCLKCKHAQTHEKHQRFSPVLFSPSLGVRSRAILLCRCKFVDTYTYIPFGRLFWSWMREVPHYCLSTYVCIR